MPKKKVKMVALANLPPRLLSSQAQDLYNRMQDLKEDAKDMRDRRQGALMENGRYETLKKQAQSIVKEVTDIMKKFDVQHPKYKKDIEEITFEARQVMIGLAQIDVKALRENVDLVIWQGAGKSKKRVRLNFSVQPTLFE